MIDLTNYTRWITASILKWLDGRRQDVPFYIEGQVRETQKDSVYMEPRIDGPFQRPCGTKDEYIFYVEISILCSAKFDERDISHIQRLLGIASQALNCDIPVYKLGDTPLDDSNYLIGCLQLVGGKDGLEAHSFGQIDATTQLIQGSVEAHYNLYS